MKDEIASEKWFADVPLGRRFAVFCANWADTEFQFKACMRYVTARYISYVFTSTLRIESDLTEKLKKRDAKLNRELTREIGQLQGDALAIIQEGVNKCIKEQGSDPKTQVACNIEIAREVRRGIIVGTTASAGKKLGLKKVKPRKRKPFTETELKALSIGHAVGDVAYEKCKRTKTETRACVENIARTASAVIVPTLFPRFYTNKQEALEAEKELRYNKDLRMLIAMSASENVKLVWKELFEQAKKKKTDLGKYYAWGNTKHRMASVIGSSFAMGTTLLTA